MGPRGFSKKNIYKHYYNSYHFAIYRGGYMKVSHILCKSLCIYNSQVTHSHIRGWGGDRTSGWIFLYKGMGLSVYQQGLE